MIPVVTPDEMAAIDAAASVPVETLIERAGAAVARAALQMLGGAYGRRVVVIAGKGNNGRDGAVAARLLRSRGCRVTVVDAAADATVPECDLVIDAAYGTGFRGSYRSPVSAGVPVLAVDIPSGRRRPHGCRIRTPRGRRAHRDLRRAEAGVALRRWGGDGGNDDGRRYRVGRLGGTSPRGRGR
ncbi:MAG: NAD(P)H-hydrate epimerase [Microthrixaceae bacterium]